MSIFSGLFKSRDKPQNSTAGSGYHFYLGGTTSGKAVTERSAMQMTAVYSCFTSTDIRRAVARKKPSTIRCTCCFMMNRTRR